MPNVLIIEDDYIIQMFLGNVIRELGYINAGMVNNSDDAFELMKSSKVDLVLLDVGIRGKLNGVRTAHRINSTSRIPIVFITGNSDQSTYNKILSTNPVRIIRKPIDDNLLKIELQAVCKDLNLT